MINIEDIVKEIVAKQFEYLKNKVKLNYTFIKDYSADSLDLMELFMAFEKKFNIFFSEKDILNLTTSAKVIKFIKKHIKK